MTATERKIRTRRILDEIEVRGNRYSRNGIGNRHDRKRQMRRARPVIAIALDALESGDRGRAHAVLCEVLPLHSVPAFLHPDLKVGNWQWFSPSAQQVRLYNDSAGVAADFPVTASSEYLAARDLGWSDFEIGTITHRMFEQVRWATDGEIRWVTGDIVEDMQNLVTSQLDTAD